MANMTGKDVEAARKRVDDLNTQVAQRRLDLAIAEASRVDAVQVAIFDDEAIRLEAELAALDASVKISEETALSVQPEDPQIPPGSDAAPIPPLDAPPGLSDNPPALTTTAPVPGPTPGSLPPDATAPAFPAPVDAAPPAPVDATPTTPVPPADAVPSPPPAPPAPPVPPTPVA